MKLKTVAKKMLSAALAGVMVYHWQHAAAVHLTAAAGQRMMRRVNPEAGAAEMA